jgi:hypothetical protein
MLRAGKEIDVVLKDALIRIRTDGKLYNRSTFDGIGMQVASHINKNSRTISVMPKYVHLT